VKSVTLQAELFEPGALVTEFLRAAAGAGAAVTFTGIVRVDEGGSLKRLVIEHYAELAESAIAEIVEGARVRFRLLDVAVIHRYGPMLPDEPIMQVMTSAPHRADAFLATEYLMDYLKTDAPFWKKEESAGGSRWVDAKTGDDTARERWAE